LKKHLNPSSVRRFSGGILSLRAGNDEKGKSQSVAQQIGISIFSARLDLADSYCLKPFLALLYLKGNLVALVQVLEAVTGDTCIMNKHILATRPLDKAKTF